MATGDIIDMVVDPEGWYVEPKIEGLSSGGTYDNGYGSDLDPADANLDLTMTCETFSGVGGATTKQRTLYGTKFKRQAYPNEASADETIDGSDVILRHAISDYIYAGDTSITANIATGLYTQGGTPNNAAIDYVVTNSSTCGYFYSVANFAIPIHGKRMGFNQLTLEDDNSGYFEVRISAWHRDGLVPCVKVTAVGQSSAHSEIIYASLLQIENTKYEDYYKVPEYIFQIPISGFTQGELVDIDFVAYPSIGDSSVLMDSSLSGKTMPTSWPATQTVVCDKNHTYGTAVAVVSTTGNDGTGAVVALSSFVPGSPPNAFLTIGAAITAIRAFNNTNYSRDEVGGGIIYLQSGSYAWTGASVSSGTSTCYLTVTPFPGLSRSDVSITSQTGDRRSGSYIMFNNITLNLTATFLIDYSTYAWFHKVHFENIGATQQYVSPGMQYFTCCLIEDLDQGFRPYSTQVTYTFLRGNDVQATVTKGILAHVIIGNNFINGTWGITDYITATVGALDGCIIAYNNVQHNSDSTNVEFGTDNTAGNTIGHAFICNIFNKKVAVGSSPLFWIAADGTGQYTFQNIIVWFGVIDGQRTNLAYNDYSLNGIGAAPRLGWSIKGNWFDDFNMVTDIDAHGGTPDGVRTGNHALIHGCGLASNIMGERLGAAGGYLPDFTGLKSQAGTELSPIDPLFTDEDNDDFTLQEYSPLIDIVFEEIGYSDLAGNLRSLPDEAGAYIFVETVIAIIQNHRKQQGEA